jgi:hypothetical protein
MRTNLLRWSFFCLFILSMGTGSSSVLAYGEPQNGFPNWEERIMAVLTNRARCDPQADLAGCSACAEKTCYNPVPPTVYSYNLNRAARFQCDSLAACACGLQHASACDIVSDISSLYDPGPCDGSPECACQGGVCDCTGGTAWDARSSLFGTQARAENAANDRGDPWAIFYALQYERDTDSSCGLHAANGHRYNILTDINVQLGVGRGSGYYVQDFARGSSDRKIGAGAHYPNSLSGPVKFMANWYDAAGPALASVDIDGTCHAMSLERGSETNGSHLYEGTVGGTCPRYYFIFEDSSGTQVTYPDTGSFGIGSGCENWTEERPAAGDGCGCTPDCGAKVCGDDGCGGSCGDCDPGSDCNETGQCVASPADEAPEPVPDVEEPEPLTEAEAVGPDVSRDAQDEGLEEMSGGCGCAVVSPLPG